MNVKVKIYFCCLEVDDAKKVWSRGAVQKVAEVRSEVERRRGRESKVPQEHLVAGEVLDLIEFRLVSARIWVSFFL